VIALLDTDHDLDQCAAELGCEVGRLLTSGKRPLQDRVNVPWAIDNRAYVNFDARAFMALLKKEEPHREHCLFVTVPDVVGSARRTLEVFEHWRPRLPGWRIALACQDGQEHLPIPWGEIDAVFIGGSTNFKCGHHAAHIIRTAKMLGKWVHVGRVNTPARFKHFEDLGADSCDGSGIARYTHMREDIGRPVAQVDLEDLLQ